MSLASGVGIASGIDFNSIITQIRQVNSRPISLMGQKQRTLQTRGAALDVIQKAVAQFQSAAGGLTDRSSFLGLTALTSDRNVLTATVGENATAGSYSVFVRQLAQASRTASQGVQTLNATSVVESDGTFAFKIGNGATVSVDVTTGMTLQDLQDAINNLEGVGVRASVINDGTATNPYRLVLTSSSTGAASQVTIVNNDTTLNLSSTSIEDAAVGDGNTFDGTATSGGTYTGTKTSNIVIEITSGGAVGAAGYRVSTDGGLTWSADDAFTTSASAVDVSGGLGVTVAFGAGAADFAVGDRFSIDAFAPVLQQARDAVLEVDGIQVSRSGNSFENVIDGVTLSAVKASTDPQSVTVSTSTANVNKKLNDFVQAYNALVDTIKAQTAYDVKTKQAAALFGDAGVNSILNSLRSTVTGFVPGLTEYGNLSAIGINIGGDGELTVDSVKLDAALKENPNAVADLFVEAGHSTSSAVRFVGSSTATQTGDYSINVTQAATQASATAGRVLEAAGLTADETVTIVYGENKTAIVNLTAGMKLSQIVAAINQQFESKGITAIASSDGGALKINTTAYGSTEKLSVVSNTSAAAAGQLGIGTSALTSTGKDVVASINGVVLTGEGRDVTGPKGTAVEGLRLEISATGPLTTTLGVTRGISIQLEQLMEGLTSGSESLFASRSKSIQDQVNNINEQIETLQLRLNRQDEALRQRFVRLEQKLATLQNDGNYLLSQLSSIIQSQL
jgi:flagellar hook-associated protein 2